MSADATLEQYVDQFRFRLLQDALTTATAAYWRRRAERFEAARSRPGDFLGTAPDAEGRRAAADRRLADLAQACRNRAEVSLLQDDRGPEPVMCPTCGTPTSPWSCSCGETRIGGETS